MAQLAQRSLSSSAQNHLDDTNRLYDKANYVFDVMDFGAAANGSTDDSAAFQAAINAAVASWPGGTVYVPMGYYALESSLTIVGEEDVKIVGEGPNRSMLKLAANGVTVFDLSDPCQRIHIEGFWIGALEAWTTGGAFSTVGTVGEHSRDITFRDMLLQNLPYPVITRYTDNLRLEEISVTATLENASVGHVFDVHSTISARFTNIDSNVVGAAMFGGDIFHIDYDCDSLIFDGCEIGFGTVGFHFLKSGGETGPRLVRLTNCYSESNTSHGFEISAARDIRMAACHGWINEGSGFVISGGDSITITDTSAAHNDEHGILVSGGTGVKIGGSTFSNNSQATSATYSGIAIGDNVTHVRVSDNRSGDFIYSLANKQAYGLTISATGTNYIVALGNDLEGNDTGGLDNNSVGANNAIANNVE